MDDKVQILTMEDCIDEMLYDYEHGLPKGSTTHIPEIDHFWRWRLGEVSIDTGYNNQGKSTLLRYLAIIKAIVDGWNFAFSAPEDFPAKSFFDDMIHTVTGQSTDRDRSNYVSRQRYLAAYELLKGHFTFVYKRPPENSVETMLSIFEQLDTTSKLHGVVIDPIIKHARSKEAPDRDDLYASYITTIATDFARRTNTAMHIVMHQQTPKTLTSGEMEGYYPKPSSYTVKGGGTWSDGVDNVLYIHRPFFAKDKENTTVGAGSEKIKNHKLVAIPGDQEFMFDRRMNQYVRGDGTPLFDFTKYLP